MSTRVKSLAVIERYLSLCYEQAAAEDDEKLLYELTLHCLGHLSFGYI
jgi:hypothetical protein